jgi:hypothetical protein
VLCSTLDTLVEHLKIIFSHIGVNISFYILKFLRILRKLFEPKKDDVTGEGRKLYSDQLCDAYSSPNTIRLIKSGRKEEMEGTSHTGEERCVQGFDGEA